MDPNSPLDSAMMEPIVQGGAGRGVDRACARRRAAKRAAVLYRCARAACFDAPFARAVLATYKTPHAVPAADGVEPRDAQRIRASS